MERNFFESFNRHQIENYERETGINIPGAESLQTDHSPFEVRASCEKREISESVIFEL